MSAKKLIVLRAITPPGFEYKILERDGDKLTVKTKLNICKVGNVIEVDEDDLVSRGLVKAGYIQRNIDAGIWVIAPASERVTDGKRATFGAFLDATSGKEKPNPVSTEADKGNI